MFSQLLRNHIVDGIVSSTDLDDDMVGPSIEGTKLRSNVYRTENADWQEIDVSYIFGYGSVLLHKTWFVIEAIIVLFMYSNVGGYGKWSCVSSERHFC